MRSPFAVVSSRTAGRPVADRSRLLVAIVDAAENSVHSTPASIDVLTVEVTGELVPFDADLPAGPSQVGQLHRLLVLKTGFAVQRGERLDVAPIEWNDRDRPSVSASAEPGDDLAFGHGFYVNSWPSTDDLGEQEPIAPYRRSSLDTVADAMCDVIVSWGVSPINLVMTYHSAHRGAFKIPD